MTFLSRNNCLEAGVSVVVLCINRCSQQTSARFFTTPACGLRLKGPLIADKGVSASFSRISPQFGIGIKASHRMAFGWSRARLRPRFHHLWRYERDAGTASVDKRHKSRSLKGTFFSSWNNGSNPETEEVTEKTRTISFSQCVWPLSRFYEAECVLNAENPETDSSLLYSRTNERTMSLYGHVWYAGSIITF